MTTVRARALAAATVLALAVPITDGLASQQETNPAAAGSTVGRAFDTSTFFGGRRHDYVTGVTSDTSGNIYVVGTTYSPDLTTRDALDNACAPEGGCTDAFFAKFTRNGELLVSTYIGGSRDDFGGDVEIGPGGAIYLSGNTTSSDFPATSQALDPTCGEDGECGDANNPTPRPDGWVARLSPDAQQIEFATYLGAGSGDYLTGLAVDAAGNPVVGGYTQSYEFPTTAGAYDETHNSIGSDDGFVAKLSAGGDSLIYSTYFGGKNGDEINDLEIDAAGAAYVTGLTFSRDLPTTPGVLGPGCSIDSSICYEGFAAKLSPSGDRLDYSTYLTGANEARAIEVGDTGHAYIVGESRTLKTTAGVAQPKRSGRAADAYVLKLDPQATRFDYATYFGGSATGGVEVGIGLDIDSAGRAFITGTTGAANLPLKDAVQPAAGGGLCRDQPCVDGFIAGFSPDAGELLFATYAGGSLNEEGYAVHALGDGDVVAVGRTWSPNFPVKEAHDATFGGESCPHPTTLECSDGWIAVVADGSTQHRRHALSISLSLRKHLLARGRVRADDGSRHCLQDIPIEVRWKVEGRWKRLAYTVTDAEGAYRLQVPDAATTFRTRATRTAFSGRNASLLHVCAGATSPRRSHRH